MGSYPPADLARSAAAASPVASACAASDAGPAASDAGSAVPAPAVRGARIARVEEDGPFWAAGFETGCVVHAVDGEPLRDIIDWRWLTGGVDEIALDYTDTDGDSGTVLLEREPGEEWGVEFDGLLFDGVKLCRNACTFCFMRQLPRGMRPSLYARDDDFRLSFLTGTFVTLTNMTPDDEARIVGQHLSPLRFSLHVRNAAVRERLIGGRAAHGLEVFERLQAAGIRFETQVVLVPGENDGAVLDETLAWAAAQPAILNVGIVPLGYTRHQRGQGGSGVGCETGEDREAGGACGSDGGGACRNGADGARRCGRSVVFTRSYDDAPAARTVLAQVERAQGLRGRTPWVFAADEFYLNAYGADALLQGRIPPASHYGDFSLFEDGVGMVRSFADDWEAAHASGLAARTAAALAAAGMRVRLAIGEAMAPVYEALLPESPLASVLEPVAVPNAFFGGNVTVTGLLTGSDIRAAFASAAPASAPAPAPVPAPAPGGVLVCVPRVVFNDDGLTLDGYDAAQLSAALGMPLHVVSCNPTGFLAEFADLRIPFPTG